MQALILSRNRAVKREMAAAQHAHVMEVERANTELKAELEQAQIKIAEMEECRYSLQSVMKNWKTNVRAFMVSLKL
jgi:hypothetical protein